MQLHENDTVASLALGTAEILKGGKLPMGAVVFVGIRAAYHLGFAAGRMATVVESQAANLAAEAEAQAAGNAPAAVDTAAPDSAATSAT